ncbi:response regulator transcription factor [Sphingobacterium alkalisoli]|uniref:Response regulator transcription factor n=1 Tax=Sphingobacterium alkalisoli TaxID=1874115 RepID=A0A4V5LYS2_9SPHI|nr:LytTR family DNA-binding domain-containing protein [Sphingobacterium alkalisoli]TJY67689.1 response regulator transcription factor [Sphingobacterium alkalisoli]GGH11965.1 DNA-binding response regulator [Sphingobacterium alkalisoli]
MKILKCLIVDDEDAGIEGLTALIKKRHDLLLAGSTKDPREVVRLVEKHSIELVFLDLQMPHMHGLDVVKALNGRTEVICCSAHKEFGTELSELEVALYLKKPIKEHLFNRMVERVWEVKERHPVNADKKRITPLDLKESFMFRMPDNEVLSMQLIDIELIESSGDNTFVTHTDGRVELCYGLGEFMKLLPAAHFIRIHKGYIVAVKNIGNIKLTEPSISLRNSLYVNSIPIGRTYMDKVRELIMEMEIRNRKHGK